MSWLKPVWVEKLDNKVAGWLAPVARRFPRTARFLGIIRARRRPLTIVLFLCLHIAGFFMSIQAVMQTRSEQGAAAWAISLNTVPVLAVPAWIVFGDSQLEGYRTAHRAGLEEVRPIAERLIENLEEVEAPGSEIDRTMEILERLASMPAIGGNDVELLVDGSNTYHSIFEAIDAAERYVLIQFYIIRQDEVGTSLKDKLIAKANQGVDVFLIVDDFGSIGLPDAYLADLRQAGVRATRFMDLIGAANRFQLNFRNHRKIVVVDGTVAFLGGHNIGDEYLGRHPEFTPWRDSHIRITGPVVKCIQVPFVEDWLWATGELLENELDWHVSDSQFTGEMEVVCLATGPADPIETCGLFFLSAINHAVERVWIATPYFVPDEKMVAALQLAALRGVDVRVLMPDMVDSVLVHYSSFSYIEELDQAGVKLYRYGTGFLHQKVVLVDDHLAAIGSANFDNRSFRLNFECTAAVYDEDFNAEVAEMLENDLAASRRTTSDDVAGLSLPFRLKSRLARLLAPIQ